MAADELAAVAAFLEAWPPLAWYALGAMHGVIIYAGLPCAVRAAYRVCDIAAAKWQQFARRA